MAADKAPNPARRLEVCVDDPAGLDAALRGGADRIELCSALALGGLTPSLGFMQMAGALALPVYAMIRPRAGDFYFSPAEADLMEREIAAAREAGLAGVVLGAGLPDGRLDIRLLERLLRAADGLGTTLHRAFDLAGPDFDAALDHAIGLGFERVLTSGGARTAPDGLPVLARLMERAEGRITVMPGSGITAATLPGLIASLPITEVHASCSKPLPVRSPAAERLGFASPTERRTDEGAVRALKALLAG
ncbi:copper homeostasis protein CutC [Aureimonas ureilytica]|uniref:PF03932 family protein CutC n=1 Tax=Aureimonas ureilytica TaxID=401562 RepID=A0A175RJV5_9HYPH|nr:copper homeostasis protein CutC [Aureimonas ureilytica]KTR03926.1 copper homeostasis protein CutC [Aureimonas ureilytica]